MPGPAGFHAHGARSGLRHATRLAEQFVLPERRWTGVRAANENPADHPPPMPPDVPRRPAPIPGILHRHSSWGSASTTTLSDRHGRWARMHGSWRRSIGCSPRALSFHVVSSRSAPSGAPAGGAGDAWPARGCADRSHGGTVIWFAEAWGVHASPRSACWHGRAFDAVAVEDQRHGRLSPSGPPAEHSLRARGSAARPPLDLRRRPPGDWPAWGVPARSIGDAGPR
jgi:hypothetical protein